MSLEGLSVGWGEAIAAAISALGVWAGVRVQATKSRGDREVAEIGSATTLVGGWKELVAANREHAAELNARIDHLEAEQRLRAEYDAWVARLFRGIQAWAEAEGRQLPQPPMQTFEQWKLTRTAQ